MLEPATGALLVIMGGEVHFFRLFVGHTHGTNFRIAGRRQVTTLPAKCQLCDVGCVYSIGLSLDRNELSE